MTSTRMRQAVLVARDYEPVASELQAALGLADPFHDPGVGHFGLCNGVFNPGRDFIEIVAPTREGTTAGRFLDRLGADGGYMIMFQVPDADVARARMGELGVRIVWTVEHPDIVDLHLHPKDVPAAIVSLTDARPRDSWRWGGEAWEGQVPDHGPGRLTGLTVRAEDPTALAARWGAVLDVAPAEVDGAPALVLDDGAQVVRFVPAEGAVESIVGIGVAVPTAVRAGRDQVTIGNVAFTLTDA